MFIYEIHGFSLNIKQLHLSATFYCDILDFLKLNTNIFSSPTVKKPRVRWENFQNLEFQNRIHKECVTKKYKPTKLFLFPALEVLATSSYIYLNSLVISNNNWYLRERDVSCKRASTEAVLVPYCPIN